ncbi:DUF4118 domain-containing protein [Pseudoalteromonas fenneropenaei]|uniref:histidine kinase n=1 Tax=Pseudoalteromonas fenneropenaei TaxID=1737459 RepID=A0ABV7CPR8_9GAMM
MFSTLFNLQQKEPNHATSAAIVAVFSIIAIALEAWFLPKTTMLLLLQMAVVIVAFMANRVASVVASISCALVFNYFATEPLYSLHMTDLEDIINTLIFLVIALTTSAFADHYRQQSEALKQAELRSNILLSVSHDLRTPLATIIGSLSTFKEYKDKIAAGEQAELIDDALDEAHRLHHYVENLLQATKLNQQQIHLTPSVQSIWPTLQKVAERFATKRIALCKKGPLRAVTIQESLLEQAIYNLVDNALKYSPKDSKVTIEAFSDNKNTMINIIDLGPGISKERQHKVFELFYTTRHGDAGEGGSGIGLNVAKGIIEAHAGTINILNSELGCTMQIMLPALERTKEK